MTGRAMAICPLARSSVFSHRNSFTVFCAAPDENNRSPFGCHASPSQAWSMLTRERTASCARSTTVSVGLDQPLLLTMACRPSAVSTIDIGKSPTITLCPAGAMRQPLGSSVTPRPLTPGHSGGAPARWATGVRAVPIITRETITQSAEVFVYMGCARIRNAASVCAVTLHHRCHQRAKIARFMFWERQCRDCDGDGTLSRRTPGCHGERRVGIRLEMDESAG